jgi:Dolichyl-phosphate-mannose-protein mannosyltransferase
MADLLHPPAVRPATARIAAVGVRAAWIGLAGLVVVSTAIRGFLASRVPTPWILGDEAIYAELGRSLWQTGHFTILGEPTRFYTLVYPALVGGPLSLHDLQLGYTLLKWLQALVMSLAAVPVYLWGRRLVSRGWALSAAALTLAVPGLAYSGLVMTEVAFYPVFVLAAWAMARAVQKPTVANQLLAVGAVVLAVATRLQALVLVPAYVTAVALKLVFDRERPRAMLRHLPALGGLALLAAGWSAWQLASGAGKGTDALGAYRSAGEASYGFGDAAKYVVYHLADVVLLTGVVPACAVALLVLRPRSAPAALRAYLVVTVSLTAWLVVEVGVFASRLVGTVAERNLFPLAPLFFLGLVVWLQQGAPRRTVALASVVCGAFVLVALVPSSLITELTRWEAFTLVPLYKLHLWRPEANLRPLLLAAMVPLLALAAFPPVRRLWLVPAALLVVFGALSGVATQTSTAGSRQTEKQLLGGNDKRWVDEAAPAPVAFLTGGEALWTAVYENRFWNHNLQRVYTLPGFGVPGPLPQTPVGPETDGRIVDAGGRQVRARYVVASNTLTLFGKKLAAPSKAKLVLWRARPPLRLSTWLTGLSIVSTSVDPRGDLSVGGSMAGDARLVAYACSGAFKLKLVGHERPTILRIRLNGSQARLARIGPWAAYYATIPARARKGACDLEVISNHQLDVLLELTRA